MVVNESETEPMIKIPCHTLTHDSRVLSKRERGNSKVINRKLIRNVYIKVMKYT